METVESGMALRDSWFVSQVSRLVPAISDSGSYLIGLITLEQRHIASLQMLCGKIKKAIPELKLL
jgi:hypothetical protein